MITAVLAYLFVCTFLSLAGAVKNRPDVTCWRHAFAVASALSLGFLLLVFFHEHIKKLCRAAMFKGWIK